MSLVLALIGLVLVVTYAWVAWMCRTRPCAPCEGRGYLGEPQDRHTRCRDCKGTGIV